MCVSVLSHGTFGDFLNGHICWMFRLRSGGGEAFRLQRCQRKTVVLKRVHIAMFPSLRFDPSSYYSLIKRRGYDRRVPSWCPNSHTCVK